MTSTIGLVEVIAPDVADSVVTGPPMDLSHQPMVTVSAWAGVASNVASTRTSFFTGASPCPHPGDTNLTWQPSLQSVQKMGQPLFRQLTKSETMQSAFWITTTCHQVGACLADYRPRRGGLWMCRPTTHGNASITRRPKNQGTVEG